MTEIQYIKLDDIIAGDNDRTRFDSPELEELADSIRANGLQQPIKIRPLDSGKFEIVLGERRYRSHVLLNAQLEESAIEPSLPVNMPYFEATEGYSRIAAIVQAMTDSEAADAMLIENLSRVDLDPIDEAQAYQKRIDAGLSKSDIVAKTGVSLSRINDRLSLLKTVPEIHGLIRSGHVPLTYAACMSKLDNNRQRIALKYFAREGKPLVFDEFKGLVNRLYEQQCQPSMFGDLENFQASTTSLEMLIPPQSTNPDVEAEKAALQLELEQARQEIETLKRQLAATKGANTRLKSSKGTPILGFAGIELRLAKVQS